MAILCAYRTEITLAVVMIGLNCRCSKQENTVQNIVLGPPAILDGEYWYKLGEVDKDTISVLYACRSGQVGLHSELTIKKTDINGKNVWTSVIDNLSEEKWWIFPGSFSIGNTMFSLAINNRSQSEKDRLTTTYIAYAVDGDTGRLLYATPELPCKEVGGCRSYCYSEDSYIFIQNAADNGYLFHVNKYGEDKWIRRMTRTERSANLDVSIIIRDIGFPGYSNNYIVINGKLVYETLNCNWRTLHIMDIKSAILEVTVSYNFFSLLEDKDGTGIFYTLDYAALSGDTLTVIYNKYCHTPVIEKKQDPITGEWIETITGYDDVMQGKILYHISYPGGNELDRQEQAYAS